MTFSNYYVVNNVTQNFISVLTDGIYEVELDLLLMVGDLVHLSIVPVTEMTIATVQRINQLGESLKLMYILSNKKWLPIQIPDFPPGVVNRFQAVRQVKNLIAEIGNGKRLLLEVRVHRLDDPYRGNKRVAVVQDFSGTSVVTFWDEFARADMCVGDILLIGVICYTNDKNMLVLRCSPGSPGC